MKPPETPGMFVETEAVGRRALPPARWRWQGYIVPVFLFVATAAVVVWQNSRLGVLWDLSAILETSFRISLGDVPYRDFPFPFAPLTFLAQAAVIKLTGRVFFHHILYSAAVGGLATVLTWCILLNLLRDEVASPRLTAFLFSVPLTGLGIYCIFPHPFYDPDCTFTILVCILLLQELERRGVPGVRGFFTGAALVVPLFVKQNMGLAFLGSTGLALAVLLVVGAWRRRPIASYPIAGYAWIVAGSATGLALAILLIHFTAGLANYTHWTMRFAASRRMPALADMIGVYRNPLLPWWMAAFVIAAILLRLDRGQRWLTRVAASFLSAPFVWTAISLLIMKDSSDRVEQLLALWPFVLVVSVICALASMRRRIGITLVLPFLLIGTIEGAFLSQQLWGSTYAIWPLLMLLIASTVTALAKFDERSAWTVPLASVIAVSLLVSGANYTRSHERLDYASLSDGEMVRSKLPALAGLSVRGPWIPDFEELIRFSERAIPRDDGLLILPGEDLFYYATGRRPQFPVLMFDHTLNPYSPEQIVQLAQDHNIRWLVVKRDLQLEGEPMEQKDRLLELLRRDFEPVESLNNYDVYRRKDGP